MLGSLEPDEYLSGSPQLGNMEKFMVWELPSEVTSLLREMETYLTYNKLEYLLMYFALSQHSFLYIFSYF